VVQPDMETEGQAGHTARRRRGSPPMNFLAGGVEGQPPEARDLLRQASLEAESQEDRSQPPSYAPPVTCPVCSGTTLPRAASTPVLIIRSKASCMASAPAQPPPDGESTCPPGESAARGARVCALRCDLRLRRCAAAEKFSRVGWVRWQHFRLLFCFVERQPRTTSEKVTANFSLAAPTCTPTSC
jgi:hypothetical protein